MKKIYKESQLLKLSKYPNDIVKDIKEIISILNEDYGEERDVDNELEGYVLIAENSKDIATLKQDKLQRLDEYFRSLSDFSKIKGIPKENED